VRAGAVHLDYQVEILRLHIHKEAGCSPGIKELLGHTGKAGKRDEAIQVVETVD
jgi:hypothetical protein